MLFPNIAQAYTGVAHVVITTNKRRTYDIAKTESDGSKKAAKSATVGHPCLLPRIRIQSYYTKFKNSWLVGTKMPLLFYIEYQIARQPRNIHVSGSTANSRLYSRSARGERNQKYPYVSQVYTEHKRSKMRHLKPMCLTEIDFISSSVITESIYYIAIFNIRSPFFGQAPTLLYCRFMFNSNCRSIQNM